MTMVDALRRKSSILSLYASFSESTELCPSLLRHVRHRKQRQIVVRAQLSYGILTVELSHLACSGISPTQALDRDAWRGSGHRAPAPTVSVGPARKVP